MNKEIYIRIKRGLIVPVIYAAAMCAIMYSGAKASEVLPSQYRPVKIAAGIRQNPGAVAWTSDGKTIAFLNSSLQLYDVSTGRLREINIPSLSFISAGPRNMLYLLYNEGPNRRLASFDTGSMERREIPVPHQPDAVFALPDGKRLLLVSVRLTQKKLWAELSYTASVLDPESSKHTIIYEAQKTIPGRVGPSDYRSAWLWAGLRPFDTEILAVEYVKPPMVMSHLKIGLADYVTGKSREAGRIEHSDMSLPVSWSPDGNRFAFPDLLGRPGIYNIKEARQSGPVMSELITGYYPSWNPQGSQIYFGGYIINSDGSGTEKLIDDGKESMGLWSPDGRMLAIADRGSLYLIRDFRASVIPPDRTYDPALMKKRMLLKELLADKLITEQEYEERCNNLLKTME